MIDRFAIIFERTEGLNHAHEGMSKITNSGFLKCRLADAVEKATMESGVATKAYEPYR